MPRRPENFLDRVILCVLKLDMKEAVLRHNGITGNVLFFFDLNLHPEAKQDSQKADR